MNFTYDIYLNLNKTLYDFFEWKKSDNIVHVKKIPFFKIDSILFKKIIEYNFIIDEYLYNDIEDKTELYNKTKDSCIIFSDGDNAIAIKFDKNRKSIKRSFLYISEELDILEETSKSNKKELEIKLVEKIKFKFKTRFEIEKENFIKKELKNVEAEKLKYIYFECYGIKENNINEIINKFKNIKNTDKVYNNLYNILNLTSSIKNKMI